jgi:hypothetical protein
MSEEPLLKLLYLLLLLLTGRIPALWLLLCLL